MPYRKDYKYDSDCCDSYSKRDCYDSCSDKSYSSCSDSYSSCSDSDYKKRHTRRRRRKCHYKRVPYCPRPRFGKKMAAKLCPDKELHQVESCAHGYANAILDNKNRHIKWCIKVYDLSSDLYIPDGAITAAHFHKGSPCENGPILKDLCLRKYKYYPRYLYGDYYDQCACKYMYVGKGKWSCDDKHQPLTSVESELFACGLIYVNIHTDINKAGEVRGQLCDYDNEDNFWTSY